MKNLMQPFQIIEDIGLFLLNVERTFEKVGFAKYTWLEHLLTLLPCHAADVIARLAREESQSYEAVRGSLLKKYYLPAKAFRQRFHKTEKRQGESFPEFAYYLKAHFVQRLKGVDAYRDHDKVLERLCLE